MKGLKQISRGLIIVSAIFAVVACSKFDKQEKVHITAYGSTVEYDGEGVADYYLLQDDGAILYIKNLLWDYERYKDGQRVKFNYEIMDEHAATRTTASGETHDITLYYISMVPEWETVPMSFLTEEGQEHRQDSIGNDPLAGITRMFFSGDYVNVEYAYWKKENKPHNMNLVVDDMTAEEGEVRVEIRHNANGDVPGNSTSGFEYKISEVSFNIRSLIPAGKNSAKIRFVWKEYGKSGPMEKTAVYSPGLSSNRPIVGSVENNSPGSY